MLGLVGGLVGVFVMQRDMAFAVHGISELSFAGAAAALLIGVDVVTGSIVGSLIAAALIGMLGARARDRNSIIGVLMPFGLGLGILFLSLYDGRSSNRFSLLTGQIVSVQTGQLGLADRHQRARAARHLPDLAAAALRLARPAVRRRARRSDDGGVARLHAAARPHRRRRGAHHRRPARDGPARHPRGGGDARGARARSRCPCSSALFGFVSAVGGILIAIAGTLPVSPYITTISFLIYVVCRVIAWRRGRVQPLPAPAEASSRLAA